MNALVETQSVKNGSGKVFYLKYAVALILLRENISDFRFHGLTINNHFPEPDRRDSVFQENNELTTSLAKAESAEPPHLRKLFFPLL